MPPGKYKRSKTRGPYNSSVFEKRSITHLNALIIFIFKLKEDDEIGTAELARWGISYPTWTSTENSLEKELEKEKIIALSKKKYPCNRKKIINIGNKDLIFREIGKIVEKNLKETKKSFKDLKDSMEKSILVSQKHIVDELQKKEEEISIFSKKFREINKNQRKIKLYKKRIYPTLKNYIEGLTDLGLTRDKSFNDILREFIDLLASGKSFLISKTSTGKLFIDYGSLCMSAPEFAIRAHWNKLAMEHEEDRETEDEKRYEEIIAQKQPKRKVIAKLKNK
jgi:hypothetical protein